MARIYQETHVELSCKRIGVIQVSLRPCTSLGSNTLNSSFTSKYQMHYLLSSQRLPHPILDIVYIRRVFDVVMSTTCLAVDYLPRHGREDKETCS